MRSFLSLFGSALLTPLEHKLACGPERAWRPLFLFDAGGKQEHEEEKDSDDDDHEDEALPDRSGAGPLAAGAGAALVARESPAAALLRRPGRWVGVDAAAPDTGPMAAVPGRSGIASHYEDEPETAK